MRPASLFLLAGLFLLASSATAREDSLIAHGKPVVADLPIVVTTSRDVTDLDRMLPDAVSGALPESLSRERLTRLAKERGYVQVRFPTFELVYPATIFGLLDARRQTQVLLRCGELARSGVRTFRVDQLDPEEQKILRGMIAVSPGSPGETVAASPALTLTFGLQTMLDLEVDGQRFQQHVRPRMPLLSQLAARATDPAKSDREAVVRDPAFAPAPKVASVTMLFPQARPSSLARSVWIQEISKYFRDRCEEARAEFKRASDELIHVMMDDDQSRYRGNEPLPFAQLGEREQHELGYHFRIDNRARFGNDQSAAMAFLARAAVRRSQSTFVLSAYLVGDSSPTMGQYAEVPIYFRCPIDP
jgi:hypothetical protein